MKKQKVWVILGVILIALGIGIHAGIRSTFYSDIETIPSRTAWTLEFQTDSVGTSVPFALHMFINLYPQMPENFSLRLYDITAWGPEEIVPASLPENISTIPATLQAWHYPQMNYSIFRMHTELEPDHRYLIVIHNTSPDEYGLNFIIAAIPATYYPGLIIWAIGSIVAFGGALTMLQGWKRYCLLGCGINAALFLLRIAFLPQFYDMEAYNSPLIDTELYQDFMALYLPWTRAMQQGDFPYSTALPNYIYPPGFVLLLTALSYIPCPPWFIALGIVIPNLVTGYIVFLILRKLEVEEKVAGVAMLMYYCNPFVLIYGSFLWLNPPPFVLCLVLALYLLVTEKRNAGMLVLGLAVMFKQFAAVFLPVVLIYLIRKNISLSLKEKVMLLIKTVCIWILPILLISIPYLLTDPHAYIQRVWAGNMGFDAESVLARFQYDNAPVTLVAFLLSLLLPTEIALVSAYLIVFYIPLGIWFGVIFWRYLSGLKSSGMSSKSVPIPQASSHRLEFELLFWSLLIGIGLQLFYPRGTYKYYMIVLVPFIAMGYLFQYLEDHAANEHPVVFYSQLVLGTAISWILFYCERNFYLVILLIWGIYLLRKQHKWEGIGAQKYAHTLDHMKDESQLT